MSRLRRACSAARLLARALRGRVTVATLAADVAWLRAEHDARLARCRDAVEDMHAWINADPVRARDWQQWRTRHPVRVVERRPR